MTTTYFAACASLEEAKALWHTLMMEHHPDRGGDTETAQAINDEFDAFCAHHMDGARSEYRAESGFNTYGTDEMFADALAAAMRLNCRVEIIGYYVYAFDSWAARAALKAAGFFWSNKHQAWIFNGRDKSSRKKFHRSDYTTDDVRHMHGSQTMREREESAQVG